ncbi:MAG: alpha/beta hydrolase [Ignavibacteria bacterium]|nr:alpha/beta hydrolase [Ignavibacteria bacterium]
MLRHIIKGLNVSEYGEVKEKTIIFIHAFPLTEEMWKPQTEALRGEFRVITYDLRGFGKSDYGDGHFTIDMHVGDLISIIDTLNINKPVICGLSMGGYIVLRAIELYQNRFSGAILACTKSEADNNPAKIKRSDQMVLLKSGRKDEFTESFVNSALSEVSISSKTEVVEFIKKIISEQKVESICAGLMSLAARTDTTDSLEKIDIPLLIISGREDRLVPPEFSKILYGKTKNSEIVVINECGHFPNLEKPDEFNKSVRDYMNEVFQTAC